MYRFEHKCRHTHTHAHTHRAIMKATPMILFIVFVFCLVKIFDSTFFFKIGFIFAITKFGVFSA